VAIAALAAACAFGLVVALLAGKASATTYTDTTTIGGSVELDPGTLHFSSTPFSDVAFGNGSGKFQLTGSQEVVSSNAAMSIDVTDATGSGDGWTVSASAPAFTCTASCGSVANGGTNTLGALQVNGASDTTPTPPSPACNPSCVLGTSNYTYGSLITVPVPPATPAPIFDQPAASGMGTVEISNIYWLLTIPALAVPGNYTGTITLNTSSGPSGS
jgi:hypothetical protein